MDVANLGHEDGIPESLPQCGDWLFFSFLPKNVQNMSKTHTRRDFSRLFGVDVLWRHRWITSGMGLSHPPGWDNISPDVKIGGYSCLKSEKTFPQTCKFWVQICLQWEKWLTVTTWWLRRPRRPWWPRQSTPWRPRQLTSWWRRRQQWKPWRLQTWAPWWMTRKQQKYLIISYLFL